MTRYDSDRDDPPFDCPTCGELYVTRRGMRTHHVQVHGESLVQTEMRECKHCGGEFEHVDSDDDRTLGLFCTRGCANEWRSENPGELAREVYNVDREPIAE